MFDFDIHNKDTVSKEGAKSIDKVLKKFGFVPNIIGVMAEAPATATSYLALADLVETTNFSDTEIQTVLMTINRFHDCRCLRLRQYDDEVTSVDQIHDVSGPVDFGRAKFGVVQHGRQHGVAT